MAYITVLYGGYKKIIKMFMYFSPPTKCFYEDVLSNTLHTILSELLRQSFQLVLIKYSAVQSRHFKLADILLVCSTAAQDKNNFFIKLQRINNKKVTKGRSSPKTSQNSQENSYATVSLYWHRCFPVKFAKFLRAPPLTEHLRWLLLKMASKTTKTKHYPCSINTRLE